MIGRVDINGANLFTTTFYVNYKLQLYLSGHYGIEDITLIYAIEGTRILNVCLNKRH